MLGRAVRKSTKLMVLPVTWEFKCLFSTAILYEKDIAMATLAVHDTCATHVGATRSNYRHTPSQTKDGQTAPSSLGQCFSLWISKLLANCEHPKDNPLGLGRKKMCAIKQIDMQGRLWGGHDYFSLREALVWFGIKWNQCISTAWHRLSCACQGHFGQVFM